MQITKSHVVKGEVVQVISGKEKTKTGKVLSVLPKKNSVIVEGLNKVKRHVKARSNEPGSIVEKEAPVHLSNVLPYCNKCKKGVRVKKLIENGNKQRVCIYCNTPLEKGE